mgnify:CR=1 FL=1
MQTIIYSLVQAVMNILKICYLIADQYIYIIIRLLNQYIIKLFEIFIYFQNLPALPAHNADSIPPKTPIYFYGYFFTKI